jgi:hypothetical protein
MLKVVPPMSLPLDTKALSEVFQFLGARNPSFWSRQRENPLVDIVLFGFVHRMKQEIEDLSDYRAIREVCRPVTSTQQALSQLAISPEQKSNLVSVVNAMLVAMAARACAVVDDISGNPCGGWPHSELLSKHVRWRLFLTDDLGQPLSPLDGVFEIAPEVLDRKPLNDQDAAPKSDTPASL